LVLIVSTIKTHIHTYTVWAKFGVTNIAACGTVRLAIVNLKN